MKTTLHYLNFFKILIVFLFFSVSTIQAATRYSVASGNWNSTGTWSATSGGAAGASFPVAGDVVVIQGGFTVTVTTTAACASIQLGAPVTGGGSGALTFNSGVIMTVSGAVVLGNTGSTSRFGTITMTAGGTLSCASITSNSTADVWTPGTGTLVLTATTTLPLLDATGLLNVYNNLTISAGTCTLLQNTTVNGILTVSDGATLANGGFTLGSPTSTVLSCGGLNGATISGTGLMTLGGNVTVNDAASGTSGATISCPVALGATRTFTVADDGTTAVDLTMSGIVSTAFGITKAGAGTMTLSGVNTFTGVTTINAGILSVATIGNGGVAGNLGQATNAAANLVLGGGTLQYTGATASTNRNYTLTAATTSTIDVATNILTISGASTATSGALTKVGVGTLVLSGANLHTGTTTVSAGSLTYGASNALSNCPITVSGGSTLDLVTFTDTVGAFTLIDGRITATTGVLTATSYAVQNGTINAVLAGAVTLTKTTTGTVVLSKANTYTGLTTVSGGTLQYGIANAIATGGVTISGGATFDIATFSDTVGAITLTAGTITGSTGILTGTSYAVQSGTITAILAGAAVGLTKSTAGTVVLSGSSNTYTGATTISAGTLELGSTSVIASGSAVVLGGGTFTTGSSTGYSDTVGTLGLTASSTLDFGTGSHTLTFAASNLVGWTASQLITVTGWTGTYSAGTSGTAGRLFVGSSATGLTAGQLAQIQFFDGTDYYPAKILSTGEVVPYTPTSTSYYAIASAAWNSNTTWSLSSGGAAVAAGIYPKAGDTVNIGDAATARAVTVPAGFTANCTTLNIGNSANNVANSLTLSSSTAAINVSGNISVNKPGGNNTNALNVNAGTAIVTGTVTLAGASGTSNQVAKIVITTGTLSISGNLVFVTGVAGNNVLDMSGGAGTLNLTGAFTATVGTLTPGTTSTFNYNGAAQTVTSISSIAYNHLTLSGSGTKTLVAAMTSVNNLTLSGTVAATTVVNLAVTGALDIGSGTTLTTGNNFTLGVTGTTSVTGNLVLGGTGAKTFTGNVTVNSGGVWNETGVATINYAGNLQNDGTTFTANTGTHTFTGTGKTISGISDVAIPNLTISGTTTNNNSLTVSTALAGASTLTNAANGIINIGGTATITGLTASAVGNLVNYNGAAQTIKVTPYNKLTLSGSGIKTIGTAIAVAGNLEISSTATVTFNATGNTAGSLSFNTFGQNSGTWGGTSTGATNINTTFFNSPVTPANKFVTVSAGSCTTGVWLGTTSNNWGTGTNWCGGAVPTATTDVVIPSGTANQPTIASGTTAVCRNLTINSSATLTLANSATSLLNISGDYTNNGTLSSGAASIVSFIGTVNQALAGSATTSFSNLTINTGTAPITVTNSTKAFSVTGNLTVTKGNLVLQATDADYVVTGNVAVASTGTLTHSVDWDAIGKLLSVAGNLSLDGVYSVGTASRAHVSMLGSGKTVHSGSSSFSILTLPTTGTITADGVLNVSNNFWAPFNTAGTFSTGGFAVTATGALLVSGGTLNINGGSLTVSGGLNVGFSSSNGAVTFSSGTLTADNLNLGDGTRTGTFAQSGGTTNVTGVLTINASCSYTVTNSPAINLSGNLVNNGVYTRATETVTFNGTSAISGSATTSLNNVTITGALTAPSATLNVGGTWNNTGTFTANGGTVGFNGAAQSISGSATTFNNVTLSTSTSTKTLGVATTIGGNLTINTGVKADLGTFKSTAATLTLGAAAQATGTSYGGTGAPAANINTTFFAPNTGYLNVGSCGTYSASSIAPTASVCNGSIATITITSTAVNLPNGTYTVLYTLGAPNAASGTSTMTVSGGTGSGSFTTSALATSGSTGITVNYLINGCVSILSSGNTATITVTASPTTATNTSTQTICSTGTATLSGNTPSVGTGSWSVVSGPSLVTSQFSSLSSPTAVFTPAGGAGSYVLQWTISNAPCTASTANATITVTGAPTTATNTSTQTICSTGTATLSGNTPSVGTGSWSVVSGPSLVTSQFSSLSSPTAVFTPAGGAGSYVLQWTISNSPCTASTANATITVTGAPTTATNTSTQTICSTGTATLSGNTPSVGTGSWSVVSGPSLVTSQFSSLSSPTAVFTPAGGAGSYVVRWTISNSPCTASTANATITVTGTPTTATNTSTQTICSTGTATLSGNTPSVGTGSWSVVSGPSLVTSQFSSLSSPTAVFTPAGGAGSYVIKWTISNAPCTASTADATITVSTPTTAGAVSGGSTICSGSTSGLLSLTGQVGSVVRWESSVSPFTTWTTITNTTTSYTSGALTQTTQFRAVVQSGSCSALNSTSTTVTIGGSTTWNGSAWSNGAPTSTTAAIISGNYTSATNGGGFSACTLTVTSGTVVISSGDNVTLNGALTVSSGSFTLSNNANLVQNTSAANSGNIIVNRDTAALMRQDYVMWGAPVASQQLQGFSPNTLSTRFYTYDSSTNLYAAVSSPSTTNFSAGTGYLIRMPNNHPATPTVWTGTFTGVPNNGTVALSSLTSSKYYAIANPYPSTINADTFITDNSLTEALYFWRKTNNAATTSYATYTLAGGVSNSGGDPLALIPNGFIQVGQGFIAKTPASSTSLTFTNSMRAANNGNQFLRLTIDRSRFWLNLTSDTGFFGQTMVAYMTGATNGYDPAIDGHFFNDSQTALTSLINGEEFSIQGRALPFDANDVVALGFKAQLAGNYTIALNSFDGLFQTDNQVIYLKDNLTNTLTDLRAGTYAFASEAGVFNTRFEVVYLNPLAVTTATFTPNSVVAYTDRGELVVNSGKINLAKVQVYDVRGTLIAEKDGIHANEVRLNAGAAHQVLLLRITSETEGTVVKKLMY